MEFIYIQIKSKKKKYYEIDKNITVSNDVPKIVK